MKAKHLLFALFLCFTGLVRAQTPDCLPPAFLAQGNGTFGGPLGYYDNRALQCQTWTVAYQSDGGITGFTLAFNAAVGANTPGSFSPVTPVTTSASFGTAQYGIATYNLLSTTTGDNVIAPFVNVSIASGTGTGSIRIELYGYRTGPTGGTGGGGGGGGGTACPNPCPVEPFGLSTLATNQQAVTASAVNLGTNTSRVVCLVADIGNTITIYFGASGVTTSTGFPLVAGQPACVQQANTNQVYVIASTTGAKVEWFLQN